MLPDSAPNRSFQYVREQGANRIAGFLKSTLKAGWLWGLILVGAVLLAYQPAWHAGFIWDDDEYVINNGLLTAPGGLKRIWFSLDSPSQYFPLSYTMFRTERALWGLNPAGYHWVNILLHAANALLVWRLMKRLEVPGAWLAAALFALHPVQVESVAWITEQKNVLSLLFCLLSALAWVEFVQERPENPWRFYVLALISYALALFSKTTACTLPVALLLILWLKKRPLGRRRLMQIVPFIVLGLGMGLVTMWWERYHQGTEGKPFALGLPERILIASRAVWFYAGKLVWPANLMFSYPRWTVNPADPLAYSWLAAGAGLCAVIYSARRWVGRSVETAALFYVTTLSPVLGFIMLYTFRYSFVADHYQYMAAIGPLALAAGGITRTFGLFGKRNSLLRSAFCGTLLLVLGLLTWRQSGLYSDVETLWRTTIARNPGSYLARNSLAVIFLERGELDQAFVEFQKSVEIEPNNPEALNNLGAIRLKQGRMGEAIAYFQKAVEVKPDYAGSYYNLGIVSVQMGRLDEAITQFQKALEIYPPYADAHIQLGNALLQKERFAKAITHFDAAMQLQPDNPYILSNLAWVLATCPEPSIRNGAKALELAGRAEQLSGALDPTILETLAAAHAESRRFPEATAVAERALALAAARNNTAQVERLQAQLKLYELGSPLRSNVK